MAKPVKTKAEAIRRIRSAAERMAKLDVSCIGLFGSFVRDIQSGISDIEIYVEFAPDAHIFDNFMDLSFFLEELLGREIELVTPESLSPHIGPQILKEVERVPIAA